MCPWFIMNTMKTTTTKELKKYFFSVVCLCSEQSDNDLLVKQVAKNSSVCSNLYLFNFPLPHLLCLPNIFRGSARRVLCVYCYPSKQPWKHDRYCFKRRDTVIWEL